MNEKDEFLPIIQESLQIASLKVDSTEIRLRASGKLRELYAGPEGKLQNPSRITWWWKNYRVKLIIIGIGLFGIVRANASNGKHLPKIVIVE